MKRLQTYWRIWKLNATNKLQETFVNRWTNVVFLIGKSVRFSLILLVLFTIRSQIKNFAGYTSDEVMIFFLVYQFIDTFAQIVYRGVYLFQEKIRNGEFDFYLLKPINPLFQSLTSYPDLNDAFFIIPTTILSIYIATRLQLHITWQSLILFLLLLINSMLIVTALHILVLVVGVVSAEVDGVIFLYRDLNQFGRFPITMYQKPLRFLLFFVVPIGMMITVPAEVFLNLNPTYSITVALGIGVSLFVLSLRLWHWALKKYSSASS